MTTYNASCQLIEKNSTTKNNNNKQKKFNNKAECDAKNLTDCRLAIMAMRGNYLEMPCYCEQTDLECLSKQNFILPNNPCLGIFLNNIL